MHHNYYYCHFFLLFGRGSSFSALTFTPLVLALQLPRNVRQTPLITLRACVLFRKSFTFALSCALPLCLCCPKNGSWHILLLNTTSTPVILAKTNFTRCTNESTRGEGIKYNYVHVCIMYKGYSPVIRGRRPSHVSELSNIVMAMTVALALPSSFGFHSLYAH